MPVAGSFQLELQRNPKPGSIHIGSGDGAAACVFGQLVELPHSCLGTHQPEAMIAGSRWSLIALHPDVSGAGARALAEPDQRGD